MNTNEIVKGSEIKAHLKGFGWNDCNVGEGRLMLAELLLKAGAGFYNSHTEEGFMCAFGLLTKTRAPNKRGRLFLCSMFYAHSNNKPKCFHLMQEYRR